MFKETKACTEYMDREERLPFEKEMKQYRENIIRHVAMVKRAGVRQSREMKNAFHRMKKKIRILRDSVDQARSEIKDVHQSVSKARSDIGHLGRSINYLSGNIADAMHMQVEALKRAKEYPAGQARDVQYANERIYREAMEKQRRQAF